MEFFRQLQAPDTHKDSGSGPEGSFSKDEGFLSACDSISSQDALENSDSDSDNGFVYQGGRSTTAGRTTEGIHFAGMREDRVVMQRPSGKYDECFLTNYFDGRTRWVESSPPTQKDKQSTLPVVPSPKACFEGCDYHLVARKQVEGGKTFYGVKQYKFRWLYIQAPSLQHLQHELEGIAEFEALPDPRKTAARLELLLSPVKAPSPFRVPITKIEVIEEPVSSAGDPMLEGCGFISQDIMKRLYGAKANGKVALQVRLVAPTLGVFKGMLMVKPNINKIQVTPSMRKVGPSLQPAFKDHAMLFVKIDHPTESSKKLERQFQQDVSTEKKRAQRKPSDIPKPVSEMVLRILQYHHVPFSTLKSYQDLSCQQYQHASVVGVADPTGCLPEGNVFITGLSYLSEVFLTRHPCIKPGDGRVFPVPVTRPEGMSEENWEWMRSLPFGCVIFSGMGDVPLPGLCADGDIDGDYYFACWNDEILRHIERLPTVFTNRAANKEAASADSSDSQQVAGMVSSSSMPASVQPGTIPGSRGIEQDGTSTSARNHPRTESRRDWLEGVQAFLTDFDLMKEEGDISKFFREWELEVQKHGIDHPDAIALAKAYTTALERKKHSSEIELPYHLKSRLYSRPRRGNSQNPAGEVSWASTSKKT